MFIALIWKFDFSPFMVLIIAILNDGKIMSIYVRIRSLYVPTIRIFKLIVIRNDSGTIMTISKDRVKPSPLPDSWKLKEIFATGIVLGGYLALMTVIFFWLIHETDFFPVSIHQGTQFYSILF